MASSTYDRANLNDVSGLVAVVTGGEYLKTLFLARKADHVDQGGTGIGLMLAKALEQNGAKVYITGRRQEKLDEAVKQAVHLIAPAASPQRYCS